MDFEMFHHEDEHEYLEFIKHLHTIDLGPHLEEVKRQINAYREQLLKEGEE